MAEKQFKDELDSLVSSSMSEARTPHIRGSTLREISSSTAEPTKSDLELDFYAVD